MPVPISRHDRVLRRFDAGDTRSAEIWRFHPPPTGLLTSPLGLESDLAPIASTCSRQGFRDRVSCRSHRWQPRIGIIADDRSHHYDVEPRTSTERTYSRRSSFSLKSTAMSCSRSRQPRFTSSCRWCGRSRSSVDLGRDAVGDRLLLCVVDRWPWPKVDGLATPVGDRCLISNGDGRGSASPTAHRSTSGPSTGRSPFAGTPARTRHHLDPAAVTRISLPPRHEGWVGVPRGVGLAGV